MTTAIVEAMAHECSIEDGWPRDAEVLGMYRAHACRTLAVLVRVFETKAAKDNWPFHQWLAPESVADWLSLEIKRSQPAAKRNPAPQPQRNRRYTK